MTARCRVCAGVTLLVAVLAPGRAAAQTPQDPRNSLRLGTQAYDFAEYRTAGPLLAAGLDPAGGARDDLWAGGLYRLAHILIQADRDSLAATWLRWALRQRADLRIDELAFPAPVVNAFTLAKSVVVGTTSELDDHIDMAWDWGKSRDSTHGGIRADRAAAPVTLFIEGVGPLTPGQEQLLAPGTYVIYASSPGYFRGRITREVLPGVTTVIRFQLRRLVGRGLLYVTTQPWGPVLLDGRPIGYTPIAGFPVDTGTHRVRIERSGYEPIERQITVTRGQTVRLPAIPLVPLARQ